MKNKKGFSLIELIIAIIIIGILSIVSIPIYRGYIEKAVLSEGKAILVEMSAAQEIYRTKNNNKYYTGTYGNNSALGVDLSRNKYFKTIASNSSGSNDSYTAYFNSEDGKNIAQISESISGTSYSCTMKIKDVNKNKYIWEETITK